MEKSEKRVLEGSQGKDSSCYCEPKRCCSLLYFFYYLGIDCV